MSHDLQSLKYWQRASLLALSVGVCGCAAIAGNDPARLWPAYLYGFLACWLICMGAIGLLALGNLTGGRWAAVGRPFYLAATQSVWLVALLFVPIGLFTEVIFPWASATPDAVLPPAKAAYLETVFFCQRAAGYFLVWLALAYFLSLVSRLDLPPASTPGMRRVGAISLVLLVPTATFAAFDWGMSLEPTWYSSIYGALLSAGGVLAAHALAIIGATLMGNDYTLAILGRAYTQQPAHAAMPIGEEIIADVLNELGNLLLAFLMVNTYFAFSQFLIIWTGNLPSEIAWYLRRLTGGWQWLALAIVILHFVVPFLALLSRDVKRTPRRLARVALLLLTMYAVHLYWMVAPAFSYTGPANHLLNAAALAALFGGWLTVFTWHANRCLRRGVATESQMP